MDAITTSQIIVSTITAIVGFSFRLGVEFEKMRNNGKRMVLWEWLLIIFFSFGTAVMIFLIVHELRVKEIYQIILVFFGSFFGVVLVRGIGGIEPDFFKEIGEDFIRKWINSLDEKRRHNEDDNHKHSGFDNKEDAEDME